jgi:maleylpyruvate isomerase
MKLYDYFRSSAAYRVRIALNLKGLAYERHEVHLVRDGGEHLKADYRAINPQARVPALELDDGTILTQSPAILEWIEETREFSKSGGDHPGFGAARCRIRSGR